MVLDETKAYVFNGAEYGHTAEKRYGPLGGGWESEDYFWENVEFQHFADGGLVTEVEAPLVVESVWEFDGDGYMMEVRGGCMRDRIGLTEEQAAGRKFKVTAERLPK